MEEKPAASIAAVAAAGVESPASSEPPSSRRGAGGQKRKASALSTSNSSSTPSKRLTREKTTAGHPPIHNGPLTRARQTPNNSASSAMVAAARLKLEEKVAAAAPDAAKSLEEEEGSKLEELEAAMESEFEAIRSRDSNAHVVPSHCGWFSWTKVHPLEEHALPSFFNGKFHTRTRDVYMEIRNWIMKKFHANPNAQIELKDLSELEVGDLDARQEVLEFLDYWGLINFHPFPPIDSTATTDDDEAAKKDSLLEKLFRFEAVQPCSPIVPKPNITMPAATSGLFPDSAIAEDSVRPEGPAVEYHCNSCSADCSRKRYHCQKQADYDLCADCFNNGKFGSNMSSLDFILMEPAEAPGASGGNWTDQETLLLLEALELYKENWNEIAEHVATKTKAQCILHFVQMPIEDAFFDCSDDTDGSAKETSDPATNMDEASGSKDVPKVNDFKIGAKEDQHSTSPVEASKQDVGETKNCGETSKADNVCEVISGQGTSKSKVMSESKAGEDMDNNFALKALTEAFEAVGYLPTPERQPSFAEVGNPVMALAAFLAKLVGPDAATAAARSSLKSLSVNSTHMQLAARHCIFLEDPPDNRNEQGDFGCSVAVLPDQDAEKDNHEDKNEKDDKKDLTNEDSGPEEKKSVGSPNAESTEILNTVNEVGGTVPYEEVGPGKLKESSISKLPKDLSPTIPKESDEPPSKVECVSIPAKESGEGSSVGTHSEIAEATRDGDMGSDLKPSEKNDHYPSVTSVPIEQPSQPSEASKDAEMASDSFNSEKVEAQQPSKSNSLRECSKPTEIPKDADMLSSQPSDVNTTQQLATSNSLIENGITAAEDKKYSKKEKPDCEDIKEDNSLDKIKRAAVSALSAATVKAKVLANQEEDQIRQLALSLIEKQLHKLEFKLAFFNEMDSAITRFREPLDRSRQRLYHERAQIIAARLGLPASAPRAMPSSFPTNRIAMNFPNSLARPLMSMTSQRPPISRPPGMLAPTPNQFVSTTTPGSSMGHSGQDKLSSVGTK